MFSFQQNERMPFLRFFEFRKLFRIFIQDPRSSIPIRLFGFQRNPLSQVDLSKMQSEK